MAPLAPVGHVDEPMRLIDFCAAVEARIDVDALTVGTHRVWPLVKLGLHKVYGAAQGTQSLAAVSPGSRWTQVVGFALKAGRFLRLQAAGMWCDRQRHQTLRPARFLFAAHSTCRVQVGDRWYDMFFDALEDEDSQYSDRVTCELIVSNDLRQPRHRASRFVVPYFGAYRWQALRQFRAACALPWFDAVLRSCVEVDARVSPRRAKLQLLEYLLRYLASFAYWSAVLERVRPQTVLIATWYSPEMMALCAAARSKGVGSIDIQHGVQGPHHWMYYGWRIAPGAALDLMPDQFWVWRDKERQDLESWCLGTRHCASVVGNRWLRKDRDFFLANGMADIVAAVEALRPYVLFSQQTMDQEFLTPALLAYLRAQALDNRIVVRMHPAMSHRRADLMAILRANGIAPVDSDLGDRAPLAFLLENAEGHVTHSSSVIIEAGLLGRSSVAFDPAARTKYPQELASGLLRVLA